MIKELSKEEFAWISIDPDNGPHRFAVASRGFFTKYDTFKSLDDALQFIFESMREDVFFADYVEIFDMRSGLTLCPSNLKEFYRQRFGTEK